MYKIVQIATGDRKSKGKALACPGLKDGSETMSPEGLPVFTTADKELLPLRGLLSHHLGVTFGLGPMPRPRPQTSTKCRGRPHSQEAPRLAPSVPVTQA